MNDKEFFDEMDTITEDLWEVAANEPFDSEKWQSGIDKFYRQCHLRYKNQRNCRYCFMWIIMFLLFVLALILYSIFL